MPESAKVAAVREALPATGAGIYLNAGTSGPLPAEVQRAMDEQAAQDLAVGRAHPAQWPETLQRMAEARAAVAAVLVADPDDIALTHSTTDGINIAVAALPWTAGDRVLTTTHEHPGGIGPLIALRDRLGVELELVDVGDGGDENAVVEAFRVALRRPARAIMVSHVLWTTGAVLPVARLAALARESGTVVIIDGAQAAGAIPVQVEALGVDAYALPAHKWLLGPEGMGALWVQRGFADSVIPAAAGGLSFERFDAANPTLHPGARRFEATGFHRPSLIGFARSCGWLSMYVGLPWAQDRAARLARDAAQRLAEIDGVRVVTPLGSMATLVAFRIDGWPAADALDELGARTFSILRDLPPMDALRASIGWWLTEDEIERFASGVALLAGHSPDSLPPRRTLTVLGSEERPIE
jgi:L-cysteine/cystine lyase